eukprot:8696665-Ditylum_brightwellii.AAC.1
MRAAIIKNTSALNNFDLFPLDTNEDDLNTTMNLVMRTVWKMSPMWVGLAEYKEIHTAALHRMEKYPKTGFWEKEF